MCCKTGEVPSIGREIAGSRPSDSHDVLYLRDISLLLDSSFVSSYRCLHTHLDHTIDHPKHSSYTFANMPSGGCFCEKVKIEYTGEIQVKVTGSAPFVITPGLTVAPSRPFAIVWTVARSPAQPTRPTSSSQVKDSK